jgi:hypothetical protein
MKGRGLRRSARYDERAQWLQLGVSVIDCSFELTDARIVDPRLLEVLPHLVPVGRCQQRADREQIALNRYEHFVDARHRLDRTHEAQRRVQLIDVAIRLDPWVVLGDTSATKQPRVAGVAGFGIDLHTEM